MYGGNAAFSGGNASIYADAASVYGGDRGGAREAAAGCRGRDEGTLCRWLFYCPRSALDPRP
eukprot:48769-Rhodomonas_salina.1